MLSKPQKLTTLERQYTPLDGHEWRDILLYQAQEQLLSYDYAINEPARDAVLARLAWLTNEGTEFSGSRLYDKAAHNGELKVSLHEGRVIMSILLNCESDLSDTDDLDPYKFEFKTFPSTLVIEGRVNPLDSDLLMEYQMPLKFEVKHPDEARVEHGMGLPTPVVGPNGEIVDKLVQQAKPEPQSSDPFIRNIEGATGMVANSIPAEMDL